MSHSPLAFSVRVSLKASVSGDRTSGEESLRAALQEAGFPRVAVPLHILQRLPADMMSGGVSVDLVLGCRDGGFSVLDLGGGAVYGIALDIGTTTLECALFELKGLRRLGVREMENPQIIFGADVLSRAQLAMAGRGEELTSVLRSGVNRLVRSICSEHGIDPHRVFALTVSGNTIMSHFFLGLPVGSIPVVPRVPVLGSGVFSCADELSLDLNPRAVVYVFPNAGSYVGGDIISGMISLEVHEQEEPVLFMDVGTNVEITLGCRDWIMVGAGAAGPALEGGVADIGRKAGPGTISGIKLGPDGRPVLTVMGGGEPSGICGSGLIDLVAELFRNGMIDRAGHFEPGAAGVEMSEGELSFVVHRSDGRELRLTERELQNFLRSKAAMFAFLYVFLRSVGMKIGDIDRIFVAGALGCGINVESAVAIGMLPDIPREKIVAVGNASLKGASMVLLDSSLAVEAEHIRTLITYREMSDDADLLQILQGALFIPHTDPGMLKG